MCTVDKHSSLFHLHFKYLFAKSSIWHEFVPYKHKTVKWTSWPAFDHYLTGNFWLNSIICTNHHQSHVKVRVLSFCQTFISPTSHSITLSHTMPDKFWVLYKRASEEILIMCLIQVVIRYANLVYNKMPCQISNLTGNAYVKSFIRQQHPRRIQEIFWMHLYTFIILQTWLVNNTALKNSQAIDVAEKLAIFIDTVSRAVTY